MSGPKAVSSSGQRVATRRLEAEVLTRRVREYLHRAYVAVDQDREVLVPGLGCDPVERDTRQGCGGGVAGAQRVGGDAGAVESGGLGAGAEHAGDDVGPERLEADRCRPDPGEQGSGCLTSNSSPGGERGDGVGECVLSVGDGDDLSVAFLIHLRVTDVE